MSRRGEQTFGDYTLIERIARGGMAEIFLARTRGFRGFEKTLVIKRLHAHYSDDAEFIHMLVDEAKISVQLQHSNIVQIFDLGHVDGQYYIAMEFIDGLDLFRVLRELHDRDLLMPMAAAAHLTAELCHGLHYAHTRRDVTTGEPLGVIHRDISPQNVLLSWAGEVKLADFGIVKATHRNTHTQAGIIKGKFYYMSPEQALGQTLDRRSDIFSAGIVLYEALTARPLYDDGDDADLLKRVQMARILSPRELRPDIPVELEAICMKALAPEREHRYSSSLDLARDLNDFVVSLGRSFTKIDLAEFLASLFAEGTAPDGGPPPIPVPAQADDPENLVIEGFAPPLDFGAVLDPGATVALPLSVLTAAASRGVGGITAETPGPLFAPAGRSPDQATVGAKPSSLTRPPPRIEPRIEPLVEPAQPVVPIPAARTGPGADQTALVPRAAISRANLERAPALSRPVTDPVADARTTRLSLDDIRQQDAQIRARLEHVEAQTEQGAATPEPAWTRRRDRSLKAALVVVLVAIMFVGAAILWLLANPINPAAPVPPPAASQQASEAAAPRDKRPTATLPPAASAPTSSAKRTGRLVLSTAPNVRSYRLYVDGELTESKKGEVRLPVGRHTIAARLQPQGRMTKQRTVRVEPGGVIRLLLE